jgi:glycosyltransferase involved in cell wall biosynthesis
MVFAPSVSIIVPAYNHAKFLTQRFESIFHQSFTNWELIILDDASTDGSQDRLKDFANHPQVSHLVLNQQNSGNPFVQWRRGIELAQNSLIWIAESDDEASPSFLQNCVSAFVEDPKCVIAYCRSTSIDEQGNTNPKIPYWPDGLDSTRWKSNYIAEGKTEVLRCFQFRNTIPNASAVVFRKSQALDIHIPTDLRFVGDWYFWSELAQFGSIHFFAQELSRFRFHTQTTRSTKNKQSEEKRVNEYLWMANRLSRQFVPNCKASGQSHDWMTSAWCYHQLGIPWSMLSPKSDIPVSIRLKCLWSILSKTLEQKADRARRIPGALKRRVTARFLSKNVPPAGGKS